MTSENPELELSLRKSRQEFADEINKLSRPHAARPEENPPDFDAGISLEAPGDAAAPPVDEFRILAFIQRQLCAEDAQEVARLIAMFKPWKEAWEKLSRL